MLKCFCLIVFAKFRQWNLSLSVSFKIHFSLLKMDFKFDILLENILLLTLIWLQITPTFPLSVNPESTTLNSFYRAGISAMIWHSKVYNKKIASGQPQCNTKTRSVYHQIIAYHTLMDCMQCSLHYYEGNLDTLSNIFRRCLAEY